MPDPDVLAPSPAFSPGLQRELRECGFITVAVIDEVESALRLGEALLRGGLRAIELTLRTPCALHAVAALKRELPEIICGVGTVLRSDQVAPALEAGARFGVAPGLNPRVVERAIECGLSFSPGVMTPSEIERAVELGCRFLKLFPAETAGGLRHLQVAGSPFQHLELRYLPLGGLDDSNMEAYLAHPWIDAAGGSWVAPRASIREGDWEGIARRAKSAREIIDRVRGTS